MPKITLNPSLKKKSIVMSFLLICVFFKLEDTFSIKHWGRDYIRFIYNKNADVLFINFTFFVIDRSANRANGYLESCKFEFTTDGENYNTLMRSETYNQKPLDNSLYPMLWLTLTHKLNGAMIKIDGCAIPEEDTKWADSTNICAAVYTRGEWACIILVWYLNGLNLKNFRLTGKWTINDLCCPDYFSEVFDFPLTISNQGLKANNLIGSGNNEPKVFKKADAIAIKGAGNAENINVYTTAWKQIKSIVANN